MYQQQAVGPNIERKGSPESRQGGSGRISEGLPARGDTDAIPAAGLPDLCENMMPYCSALGTLMRVRHIAYLGLKADTLLCCVDEVSVGSPQHIIDQDRVTGFGNHVTGSGR